MTQSAWRPVDGDEIVTTAATTPVEDDVHTAEAAAAPEPEAPFADEEPPVRSPRARQPISWQTFAIGAILVLVALQVVVGFLALGSINTLRDQSASSFGLQKCIYSAQLNATDATSEQTAIKACINK